MVREEELVAALDRGDHRLTQPRLAVARSIAGRGSHFTAADLIADSRERGVRVGRATVFRALDLFESLRLLERIDLPSGEHAYVACEPRHHHHVACSGCGRTVEVDDLGLRSVVDDIAQRTGFAIEGHRLELYGRCPGCQASEARMNSPQDPLS
jgi:Fe2+ or Zn2+ uptake regulation protein